MTPYRTLFSGTLVQESALSVGGNVPSGSVDDPLCRDGAGRFVLRGSGIAGALVATAYRLLDGDVPTFLSSGGIEDGRGRDHGRDGLGRKLGPPRSRWRVFSSHPEDERIELRQGVGIRHDTGAAAEGILFDMEVLATGTRWPFLLEVDTAGPGEDGAAAERIAAAALLEWARGRCWMGRSVARGMGWLRLEGLTAVRLGLDDVDRWPDSAMKPVEAVAAIIGTGHPVLPEAIFAETFGSLPVSKNWQVLDLSGTIAVGIRDDGYGLDMLSVGGHAAAKAMAEWTDAFLAPDGPTRTAAQRAFAPDHAVVMTRRPDGRVQPFLPGSGLRGTLRHTASRLARAHGYDLPDPHGDVATRRRATLVDRLFGSVDRSAELLVRDAMLIGDEDWRAAWIHHHAEDEFSGGVFETAKFDRVALVSGTFSWRIVVETDRPSRMAMVLRLLPRLVRRAAAGQIPVGGAKWRGAGWPAWTVDRVLLGPSGQDGSEVSLG
jgi:CRISPR/Cas system CSM-associated protein Csm3 (group 7 of RAMP superfamily)